MAQLEERGSADGRDDYTQDGTVDLEGRPVLRSKTGRWRACSFIVGNSQGSSPILTLFAQLIYVSKEFGFALTTLLLNVSK